MSTDAGRAHDHENADTYERSHDIMKVLPYKNEMVRPILILRNGDRYSIPQGFMEQGLYEYIKRSTYTT